MTAASSAWDSRSGWRSWSIGAALWLSIQLLTWPVALSFTDGVGYVGQARLLSEGKVRPLPESVGYWIASPQGDVAKYPLFYPLLLAPLAAVSPVLVFLVGIAAALLLSGIAASALVDWGHSPVWGLLLLTHPSVTLLARTVTVDVLLAAAAVGAFWALRRCAASWAGVACALTVLVKPTGIVLVAGLLVASLVGFRGHGQQRRRTLLFAALGAAAGLLAVALLNWIGTGQLLYAYRWAHSTRDEFALGHIRDHAPILFATLVLLPPGLALGWIGLWRRGAREACVAAALLVACISAYWFVDSGPSWSESLVLAPRLILPAVALLLLGYTELLASLRWRGIGVFLGRSLVILAPAVALLVGVRHAGWQAPLLEARQAAESTADRYGQRTLGLNFEAFKSGLLSRHEVVWLRAGAAWVDESAERPCVVLCNTASSSRRLSFDTDRDVDCDMPGYRNERSVGSYRILVDPACEVVAEGE